jgi:hypothetical protein
MPRIDIDARHFYVIFRLLLNSLCNYFSHLLGAFGVGMDAIFGKLSLLSLNHDLLPVLDIDALGGLAT